MIYRIPYPKSGSSVAPCAFHNFLPSGNCAFPGIYPELLLFVLKIFDDEAILSFQEASGRDVSFDPNISHYLQQNISVLDQILLDKSDISLPSMYLTYERASKVSYLPQFSKPIHLIFVIKKISPVISLDLRRFLDFDLLLSVALSFLFICIFQYCLKVVQNFVSRSSTLHCITMFKTRPRVMFSFWFGIFLGCFSTKIVLIFNVTEQTLLPFKNALELAQLLKTGEYTAICPYESIFDTFLDPKTTKAGIFEILSRAASKNPPILAASTSMGMDTMLASIKPLVFIADEVESASIKENYCNKGISVIIDSYMSGHYITSYLRKELAKNFTFGYQLSKLVQKQQEWIAMKYMRNYNCLLNGSMDGTERKAIILEQIRSLFLILADSYCVAMFLVVLELYFKFCFCDSLIEYLLYAIYFKICKVAAKLRNNF